MTLLNDFITGLVGLCALLAWVFVLRYRRLDWRSTDEGKHIMGFTLCVAIFTTLAAEVRLFGPWPGTLLVALALYGWLAYLLFSRNWLLHKAQRRERRKEQFEAELERREQEGPDW